MGIAAYGLSAIGERSIGSYIREFELKDPNGVISNYKSLKDVVEELRSFLLDQYNQTVVPALQETANKPFNESLRQRSLQLES